MAVRDTAAMIAQMNPARQPGRWHFCTLPEGSAEIAARALALMREPEGLSAILSEADAAAAGFATDMPMTHILLQVNSALDGVGLTAAVSAALAGADIPCNIVAGHHHDHVFVPAARSEDALAILARRAGE